MHRRDRKEKERKENADHICVRHAICFQCFRAGVERARARREAWAQRALPFETVELGLTPRELVHRRQMLEHLSMLNAKC